MQKPRARAATQTPPSPGDFHETRSALSDGVDTINTALTKLAQYRDNHIGGRNARPNGPNQPAVYIIAGDR
jgi:hypothetical protein